MIGEFFKFKLSKGESQDCSRKISRQGGSSKWEIKKKEKERKKKKKSGNLTNFEAKTGRITVDAARNLRGYGN